MAVGALADQMEKPFIKYMEAFLPILVQGLSNNAEYQVRHFVQCRVQCFPCPNGQTEGSCRRPLCPSSPFSCCLVVVPVVVVDVANKLQLLWAWVCWSARYAVSASTLRRFRVYVTFT